MPEQDERGLVLGGQRGNELFLDNGGLRSLVAFKDGARPLHGTGVVALDEALGLAAQERSGERVADDALHRDNDRGQNTGELEGIGRAERLDGVVDNDGGNPAAGDRADESHGEVVAQNRAGRQRTSECRPTITIARPSTTVFHWETNSLKSRSVPILTMKMPVIILEMAIRPASVNRVVGTAPVQNRIRNVTEAKSSTGMMACVLSEMKSPIANTTHTIVRANIPSIDFSSLFFLSFLLLRARFAQRVQHTHRRHGQLVNAHADGVANGIVNGGRRADNGRLADSLRAVRPEGVGMLNDDRAQLRQIHRRGDEIVVERMVAHFSVFHEFLFHERPADGLRHAAVHLSLHRIRVDGVTDVHG